MKRKLLLLNVVLLGAVVYAGVAWRDQYRAKQAREAQVLQQKTPIAPPPPLSPLGRSQAVMATGFAGIAEKMLFDRSRNPTVVVEPPPPPPVKPVPPFPVIKGMMSFGGILTVVFAERPGGSSKEVKPGEPIGQFTLLAVNTKEAVFGWDGKEFHKTVSEIMDRSLVEQQKETSRAEAAPGTGGVAPRPVVKTPLGPGAETSATTRACNPNDSNPAGTVQEGFRKVTVATPFGAACRWEAVR